MKLKDLINKALSNVEKDRENAKELVEGVAAYIGQNPERYKESGMVAAKYLETLQRSNEQLVKIAELQRKGKDDEFGDLSDEDREGLLDEIEDDGE